MVLCLFNCRPGSCGGSNSDVRGRIGGIKAKKQVGFGVGPRYLFDLHYEGVVDWGVVDSP